MNRFLIIGWLAFFLSLILSTALVSVSYMFLGIAAFNFILAIFDTQK